jgi:hypothetical protein
MLPRDHILKIFDICYVIIAGEQRFRQNVFEAVGLLFFDIIIRSHGNNHLNLIKQHCMHNMEMCLAICSKSINKLKAQILPKVKCNIFPTHHSEKMDWQSLYNQLLIHVPLILSIE